MLNMTPAILSIMTDGIVEGVVTWGPSGEETDHSNFQGSTFPWATRWMRNFRFGEMEYFLQLYNFKPFIYD
jgi:hypothetical protein